jgi:uncharacterized membrane protein
MSDASERSALSPEPDPPPSGSHPEQSDTAGSKFENPAALVGFYLGLFSLTCGMELGFTQVLGMVLCYIGLKTFEPATEKNKWRAVVGLVINFVATAVFLVYFTGQMNAPVDFPLEADPKRNFIPRTKPILPPKTLHHQDTKETG